MRRRCARCWQSWSFAARGLAAAAATSGLVWGLLAAASGARPPAPAAAEPVTAPASEADGSTRRASDEKLGTDWVRLRYDDAQRITGLETAIVRYAAPAGSGGGSESTATVDLVGAVHVGDAAYYAELNRRFVEYDALLYELVAPEGTVVPRGRGTSNAHPLGALQNGMKSLLALEHQLEQVDYTKKNFIHADMSPDEFLQSMRDRDEGFLQMYMKLLGHAIAQQSEMAAKGESADVEIFAALLAPDRPRRLKIALAKQLAETESLLVSFGGEEGSVLISERNKTALGVLREQLAAGRKKRLGLFYGAGHLADMDKRLRTDFGLEPVSITWLTAWNLARDP